MPEQSEKTWKDRICTELSEAEASPEAIACALEAYAEMRCVKLKVLLGRCYELMSASENRDEAVTPDNGFLQTVLDASK